jgi:glycine betaine/proline transport system substrate-binding protein
MFKRVFLQKAVARAFGLLTALALVATGLLGCGTSEKKAVVFADGSWDSIQVHNRIASFILKYGYGYESQFTPGDTIPLFAGLSRGDIDVNMEVWVENQQVAYDKAVADNSIIDLGGNFLDNWQGWLVPTYVISGDATRGIAPMAPDLKSVFDLPKYAVLFQDPENPTKGRFYNGATGWEATTINDQKLKEYGLDQYFVDFVTGSDAALSGSLASAYGKGEPWFGYYWEPTWVLGKYEMTRLEEPAYDAVTWNTTHACAYPANKVEICVNSAFAKRAPDIESFLRQYTTTTEMINQILAYMQDNKATTEQAATYFLRSYESTWTQWVSSEVAAKVKAAL